MEPVFIRMLIPKRVVRLLLTFGIALVFGLSSLAAIATTVVPLSLSETVRQADAIVVGTITSHQSRWGDASQRWMQTDYTLAVEDVVYPSEQGLPIGQTIVLTYWGGTIGGETQVIADIRVPVDGERLVMMLHSRWAQAGTTAPTVGVNHGLFTIAGNATSGKLIVRDAAGQPLALTSDGKIVGGDVTAAVAAGATAVDLLVFTGWLRANIGSIKSGPATSKPTVDQNDPRIMEVFAKSPAPAGLIAPNSIWMNANAVSPAQSPGAEVGAGVPVAGFATETAPSLAMSAADTVTFPRYSSSNRAHLPIVVNNFPSSFTPWAPEDQYQMSKWNYYASQVFRVYTTPTSTYGWPNGIFDLDGFPSTADLQYVYGSSWYCGSNCLTLGVTFLRIDSGGWIVEADIALNPHAGWTLDDEWVFSGSTSHSFRQTMVHELGHMHGLEHNFSSLALMNYLAPSNYRSFPFPYADDAAGIRAEYPSNSVGVTDLAVYLYYETVTCSNFNNCVSEATYPPSVTVGGSLTVNNYQVENVGTTTISTPTIEWYLTSARSFFSPYYNLGQSTYSSLPTFTRFTPSTVGRTFTVPANVPVGNYYLAAFIPNDAGADQSSFPFSNNYAFSRQRISVTTSTVVVPGAPTIGTATAGNAQATVSFTPPANNGGATITSYTVTSSPGGITRTGTTSPITVTGLTNGTSYTFTAKATNSAGTGPSSAPSNSVTPSAPITPPGAPTLTGATAGSTSATLSFTAPTSTGGSPITGYTATCTAAGKTPGTGTGTSSPILVSGLVSGTTYSCTLTATNSVGISAASNALTVTTLPPVNSADCLFNWAERTYPALFAPAGATSITLAPWYYRYYSQTAAYLGTSSVDNHVYYRTVSSGTALDVGTLSLWLATAGC